MIADPGDDGFGRTDEVGPEIPLQVIGEEMRRRIHYFLVLMAEGHQDDPREWRIEELTPSFELPEEEIAVVMGLHQGQQGVLRIGDLDQDPPYPFLTTRAPADLLHQLKGAFIHAEVGKAQDTIGVQDAHEIDMIEVEAFHHHLGADEDVDALLLELADQGIVGCLAADAVDVHARDAGLWKELFEVLFDALGPEITLYEAMVAAGGASLQRWIDRPAIVAMQLVGQLVEAKRNVAVLALRYPAADLADLVGRIATAVLEEDGLAALFEGSGDRLMESGSNDDLILFLRNDLLFVSTISMTGEAEIAIAFVELDETVLVGVTCVEAAF